MDNSKFDVINIPLHSDEWYKFRESGIGASEVGYLFPEITGGEYGNPTKLFYEKIGAVELWKEDNEAMFWGRELEEHIAEKWQYWDGDNKGYLANFKADKIVRKCRKANGYLRSKDYPWLFVSLDRVINKGFVNLVTGEKMANEGVLECKTISGYIVDKWTAGIPPSYLYQIHQQMLVTGLDYGEFAILKDGRYFDVIPIQRSELICQHIIERTGEFWNKRVVPAKIKFMQYKEAEKFGKQADMDKLDREIQRLEPEASAGESYRQFLTERLKMKELEYPTIGNEIQLMIAKRYDVLKEIVKFFEAQKSQAHNMLLKEVQAAGGKVLDFGEKGKIRFNKMLSCNIKTKFDKDQLMQDLTQFDFTYDKD